MLATRTTTLSLIFLLGYTQVLAKDVRCKLVDIDLGFSDINANTAHTIHSKGALFVRCTNNSNKAKTVELTLYDGAPPPHRFTSKGYVKPVELRFHVNESRQVELPTDPNKGVIHYRHIQPATEVMIDLPIFPQAKVPAGFPSGEFSIPFTLRVTVAEIEQ